MNTPAAKLGPRTARRTTRTTRTTCPRISTTITTRTRVSDFDYTYDTYDIYILRFDSIRFDEWYKFSCGVYIRLVSFSPPLSLSPSIGSRIGGGEGWANLALSISPGRWKQHFDAYMQMKNNYIGPSCRASRVAPRSLESWWCWWWWVRGISPLIDHRGGGPETFSDSFTLFARRYTSDVRVQRLSKYFEIIFRPLSGAAGGSVERGWPFSDRGCTWRGEGTKNHCGCFSG